jgi:recombination protein RecT
MSEPTSTSLQKQEEAKTVAALVNRDSTRQHFERMLGKRAGQFMASIVNACSSGALATANPRSVVAAASVAAALDLPIDKNLGFAFVIPYKGVAQFQLGYKGIVQLALRSGQYKRMNATPINAEAFDGYDQVGEPKINWEKFNPTKEPIGYVAAWELVNGFTKTIFWSTEQVKDHASRYSQAFRADKKDSPWFTSFDRMALKTVLKNGLSLWGILSIDMQRAFEHDQGMQPDIDAPISYMDGESPIIEPGQSMGSILGDETPGTQTGAKVDAPKPEAKGEQKPAEEKQAVTDAEYKRLVTEVENYCLNLSLSEAKAIKWAQDSGHPVPAKASKLSALPYETLGKLREHCQKLATA